MKGLALAIVMLVVTVPAYAGEFNHEDSRKIIEKGTVLAFGNAKYGLKLSAKYKGKLYFCQIYLNENNQVVKCHN